jgi:hypothetical protein
MWNYHASTTTSDQDTRNYIRSLGEMIQALEDVPPETKARLYAELADGDIATVESYLTQWGKGVTVPVRFVGQGEVGFEKKAAGGPVTAGTPYVVGDNPDGSWNATTEVVVPGRDATVLSNTQARQLVGAAETTVVNQFVTNHFPPSIDPLAVGVAMRDLTRRGYR